MLPGRNVLRNEMFDSQSVEALHDNLLVCDVAWTYRLLKEHFVFIFNTEDRILVPTCKLTRRNIPEDKQALLS